MNLTESDIVNSKFVYSIYCNAKNYFTGNFDYFKYQGLNKKLTKNFDERHKAFYNCLTIYKKYRNLEYIEKYIVLNLFNNKKWFTEFDDKHFQTLQTFKESAYYILEKELKQFFIDKDYNYKINVIVYKCYQKGSITTETLIYLNSCLRILDRMYQQSDDFLFREDYQKLLKLQKFYEKWEVVDCKILGNVIRKLKNNLES